METLFGVALRNGDVHLLAGGRAGADVGDDGAVVHIGVQLIAAGRDVVAGAGEGHEQAEEQLVVDDVVLL